MKNKKQNFRVIKSYHKVVSESYERIDLISLTLKSSLNTYKCDLFSFT